MAEKSKHKQPHGGMLPAKCEFRGVLRQAETDDDGVLDPSKLGDEERRELLASIERGETLSVRTYMTVFDETGENDYHIGLKPGELAKLAKNAKGVPFMKDHSTSTDQVVGMVEEGVVSGSELGLVVDLLDPAFMTRFVRGLARQFSVGLGFDSAECNICGEKYEEENFFGMLYSKPGCKHKPGKRYGSKVCKKLVGGAALLECSAVCSGAYKANRIGHSTGSAMDTEEILKELEEARAELKAEAERRAKLEAEAAQKDAKLADADAEVDRLKTREFSLLLNRGIAEGKINARHRPLFEKLFADSKDKSFLEEYISLAEVSGGRFTAELVGDTGGDVSDSGKVELGIAKLYKEKK